MSKQSRYIVSALAILCFVRADAQTTDMPALEADVELSYTLPNGEQITRSGRLYRSASGKVRQDIGNGSMITDLEAGTITMLIPATKEARVLAVPPELRLPPELGVGNPVPPTVQPFEETTIDGRRIAKTLTVDPQGRAQEVWTATDLGVVTFARVEADGVTTRQELRNLTEGEPDPEVFEVPGDYTVVQMPTRLDLLNAPASGSSRARDSAENALSRGTVIPLQPAPAR